MTCAQFLLAFQKFAKDFSWRLIRKKVDGKPVNLLRTDSKKCHCPITAVCKAVNGKRFSTRRSDHAARLLGLDSIDAWKIMHAADGFASLWDELVGDYIRGLNPAEKRIRNRMLAIVSL